MRNNLKRTVLSNPELGSRRMGSRSEDPGFLFEEERILHATPQEDCRDDNLKEEGGSAAIASPVVVLALMCCIDVKL